MAFYLRAINKNRWYRNTPPSWLPENEIPAQPLADLVPRPEENLSIWYVDAERTNLRRIAAAIASSRDRIDKFDYALFSHEIIQVVGLTIVQSSGKTPDELANADWHWEIVELTADKVARLAKEIYVRSDISRVPVYEMRRLVLQGVESNQLKEIRISSKLLDDLK